jgi:transcriptional regulator with XRE-family HTH domain
MDFAYNSLMQRGRPTKSPRTDFGSRIHQLRVEAGLSQREVAEHLGIGQPSYADWERRNVALSAEQFVKLADFFGVSVEELFKTENTPAKRTGPAGRAKQLLQELSALSRPRQKEILDVVEMLLASAKDKERKAS